MKWILFVLIAGFTQETQVPFLPDDEFEYEVEFFLKKKTTGEKPVYDVHPERAHAEVLPYVKIHFAMSAFRDTDRRIKVLKDGAPITSKKIKGPMMLTLDMGYTVDMKEGVTPANYSIVIFNDENQPRARVKIEVKPNGELLINEQTSGML